MNTAATPTFFDPAARNAETVVGDPSYTSGAHMWNGTVATLNPNPARRNTRAMMNGGSRPAAAIAPEEKVCRMSERSRETTPPSPSASFPWIR